MEWVRTGEKARFETIDAALDTDNDADGVPDTGLFVWSHSSLRLVARTGTVIPGMGTVAHLVMNVVVFPPPTVLVPSLRRGQ